MNSIDRAKFKAETFLRSIVLNTNWDNVLNNDWPLFFEAFNYLGNKFGNLKTEYGIAIRSIWQTMERRYDPPKYYRYNYFWPAVDYYLFPINDEEADRVPGLEIENHLAMFRAKEVFAIPGYDRYFQDALKRIECLLLDEELLNDYDKNRLVWQVGRSIDVRSKLGAGFSILGNRISDHIKNHIFNPEISLIAKLCFFLLLLNQDNNHSKIAQDALMNCIDLQCKDGSFEHNTLTTSLILLSLFLADADPNRIIISKGVEWLLSVQTKGGSWEHWGIGEKAEEADVFSTVHVLETLDLIMNDAPLPFWANSEAADLTNEALKAPQIQLLPVHKGISWGDVSIRFISDESVDIRAGAPLGIKNFIELGFRDRRSDKPDYKWILLKLLAKSGGEISWKDRSASIKLKSHIKTLRKRLIICFGIQEDPFFPYKSSGGYRTKFAISFRDDKTD
jgi:hypothetical protein